MANVDVRSVRRGRSPNCSATGMVVGAALLTVAATGVVVNLFADRLAAYLEGGEPPAPPRVRTEHGGSLLSWALPPALLWVSTETAEAALARGAVLHGPGAAVAEGAARSAPIEVHVSLGRRCPVACDTCHVGASPEGDPGPTDVPAVLAELARAGVFEVAFGGGEVLLRPDLVALGREARRLGLVPNLTTSGIGLTRERARELAGVFGQVNVSVDGVGDTYRAVRGFDGSRVALRALELLADAGVPAGVNTVVTRANADSLVALGHTLAAHGAREWQWLRLKPVGRAAATWAQQTPTEAQLAALWPAALQVEREVGIPIRWDCAMVPFLAAHAVPPETLVATAVEGCPGGRSLATRNEDGRWAPCSFAAGGQDGPLAEAWRSDPQLSAWRDREAPAPCVGCDWYAVCGSGCRVVAAHVTGDPMAADPECPRVRAHQASA
jgi:radical SAM protein with 4Fe4S-binding SPASM domain